MFKALKLAWIPRLIKSDKSNWCTIPNHFFKRMGGLNFLLRCNYDTKHFNDLPVFYKTILDNFNELKNLYDYYQKQDIILFNNKEILIGGKQFFWSDWFKNGIISIKDLLDETGNLLTFHAFSLKYSCKTSFLQYYQVLSAIPKHLLSIAKQPDTFNKSFFTSKDIIFPLNESTQINFGIARSRDFYKLLVSRTHTHVQTGPNRWSEKLSINKDSWTSIFKSLKNICKETRLREFQFKLIHRIVITRKELFKFGIKTDDECLHCGDKDSIDHTFQECPYTASFAKKVIQWFNEANCCQISHTSKELLFGIIPISKETKVINKFNYTTLSMRHYIYTNKNNSKGIYMREFIGKLSLKYELENIN